MLKYQIKSFLQQLRLTSNNDYEFVRWMICVFLAGAVYSIILYQFGIQLASLIPELNIPTSQNPDAVVNATILSQTVVYALILFVLPPLLSITSTRLIPEKRIVPPFFIHMIGAGYLSFYFATTQLEPAILFVNIFVLFVYTAFGGLTHDLIVQTILGRNVRKEDLITYSYKTKLDVKTIENFLMLERNRNHFKLEGKIDELDDGVRLKNRYDVDTRMVIEIKTSQNDKNITLVNLAFFDKGRYYFKHTERLIDDAEEISLYFNKLINDKLGVLEDAPKENASVLVNDIIEHAGGLLSQVDKISKIGWAKIISFMGVIAIATGLIGFNYMTEGVTALLVVLLYLVFDLPRKLLSRKH